MIEINLLPEELRRKLAKPAPVAHSGAKEQDLRKLVYVIPFAAAAILLLHITLAFILIFKNIQLAAVNKQWKQLAPEKVKLESVQKEYSSSSQDTQAVDLLLSKRVDWAEKLNNLSAVIPSGMWFNEMLVSSDNFILRGSVVSTAKEEIGVINKFMDSLKKDPAFTRDFDRLELGSVTRRTVYGYEIADFVLNGRLKSR